MKIQSKALEVNLASYYVDVAVDERYRPLQAVMAKYYGLQEGLTTFLKELSHPYKNWQFIVKEARGYSLNYFHLLARHPQGPEAARLYVDIFLEAITTSVIAEVRGDAVDNLVLFLLKITKDAGADLERLEPVLADTFDRIRRLPMPLFFLFVKGYYSLPRLGRELLEAQSKSLRTLQTVRRLIIHYYQVTYSYWLDYEDPQAWFEQEADDISNPSDLRENFAVISHDRIQAHFDRLEELTRSEPNVLEDNLAQMLQLPGYNDLVNIYRELPQRLFAAGGSRTQKNLWKLLCLFHIMNSAGLSTIHEEALREINRTLTWLISNERYHNVSNLIARTFTILADRTSRFPLTALNCVLNMGQAVYQTDESDLVNFFIEQVIDLGFQTPAIAGVGDDWQIKMNNAHIQNIRTWMELIHLNPAWSVKLLSALIVNLSLFGVLIKDTDLFPRDITRLLDSDIGPVYSLAMQLARLFPTYFNDIGAEGQLREISTEIDEITHRKDVLIHFLRKQSHVESSNRIINFMEATLCFWRSREKHHIKPYVPPDIYNQIQGQGPYVDGVGRVMQHLERKGLDLPRGLLTLSKEQLGQLLEDSQGLAEQDRARVQLAAALYKLLNQKYNLDFIEMDHYLAQLRSEAFPDLDLLKSALAEKTLNNRIFNLLDYMERLKCLILSDEQFEIREDIYKKRHFTVDIPSMYGSYHERKFDALGLSFRIESLLNVMLEELIDKIDLSLITKATFFEIYDCLMLFDKALRLQGLSSLEFERQLDLLAHSLEVREFTFTQYVDVFKGFAKAVKNIINDHFINVHDGNLKRVLSNMPLSQVLPKYLPRHPEESSEEDKLKHRVSEIFFRDRIATSLGLQQLDRFLSHVLGTLFLQSDKLPKGKLRQLLIYDPQNVITPIERVDSRVAGIIYLGNKGLNMVRLKNFGLPIPPGFIITTEVFRFQELVESYPPAEENFLEQVTRKVHHLENLTGQSFGDPRNPLLFSVRSGSSISQPGMMDTFLNVGMNEEIAAGLEARTGNGWFAWDNYRRFLQCYGMAFGLDRNHFDAIIKEHKRRVGIPFKREFTDRQMRSVALDYKRSIKAAGIDIMENPFDQLHLTIRRVLSSWDSPKARTYRKIMGISDDWGTAVTVQQMVFGNLTRQSGSGVIFTHNPRWAGNILKLYGDFTIGNQGEDVVAGLVSTLPVSISQQEIEMRDTDVTLETHFTTIYTALKEWAQMLVYQKGWGPQEMEFTFEGPTVQDLYLLQTRDMAIRERADVFTFELEGVNQERYLGHGIGVSGGAMAGRAVFTLDEIDHWRSREPDTNLILLRGDTVPDDIREISAADGLLTARGGLTSHAAVVAARLGKTCVVGYSGLVCDEKNRSCRMDQRTLSSGDYLSIDGHQGAVYQGLLAIKAA